MTSVIKRPIVLPKDGLYRAEIGLTDEGKVSERIIITLYPTNGGYMVLRIGTQRKEIIVDDYRNGFSRNTIVAPE